MVGDKPPLSRYHRFFDPRALVRSYLPTFPGGGLFLRTDEPYDLWTRFFLSFTLPHEEESINCLVEVIWVNRGDPALDEGMGVRFVRIDPKDKKRLDDFLETWGRREEYFDGRFVRLFPLADDPGSAEQAQADLAPVAEPGSEPAPSERAG